MSAPYSFKKAHRIVVVQLNHDGSLQPFVRRRNADDVFEPAGAEIPAVSLGDGEEIEFDVYVPSSRKTDNAGFVCHEFSNWGIREYQYVSTYFLGTTWPFGQDEYVSDGPSPDVGQVERVSYVFKQVRDLEGKLTKVWALNWSSAAGLTRLTGAVDIVAEGGGGGSCYVVLRLTNKCSGSIEFTKGKYGHRKITAEPDELETESSTAPSAAPASDRGGSQEKHGAENKNLSDALAKVYQNHKAHWEATKAAQIPQEYLDPIQKAIFDYATGAALVALNTHGSAPGPSGKQPVA